MREIRFYRTASGRSPAREFLESLSGKQAQKVLWVLRLVEEVDRVPVQYFKKLTGTDDLWEVRAQHGSDTFRLIGFLDGANLVVLVSGFAKNTQKLLSGSLRWPRSAGKTTSDGRGRMGDLKRYSEARAVRDPEFAEGLEGGYEDFKLGVLLRQAREEAGLTQEEVATRLNTHKSAISRIENRAGDIRLSTLDRYARAIGRQLSLELRSRSAIPSSG